MSEAIAQTKETKTRPEFVALLKALEKREVWFDEELNLLCVQHGVDPDGDDFVAVLFDENWHHQDVVSRYDYFTAYGCGGWHEWVEKPGIYLVTAWKDTAERTV